MAFPSSITAFGKTYVPERPRFRLAWDDEIKSYGFKCRTQMPTHDPIDSDNPPAVLPFFSVRNVADRQRVNLEKDPTWKWKDTIIHINGGGEKGRRAFEYLTGPSRAQFNDTGWARMAYVGMCGNEIKVLEIAGEWVRFETLKPTDWLRARGMSRATHPQYIHSFHCITWVKDASLPEGGFTRHIESTGTKRGVVWYPLVTNEGYAWIQSERVTSL